jgi:hypothetical protein
MKNLILSFIIIATCIISLPAQSEKFQVAMGKSLATMSTNKSADDWKNTANTFARIAQAEPNEWLPKFYTAQCRLFAGYDLLKSNMVEAQELAKTALADIQAAEKIAPTETELMVLEAFTYQLQLIENPMANGAQYTPLIYQTLGKAEAINPANPRIYSIRGQFTLNMPEFYGGGVAKATPDIQKAAALFETFKPASALHPNWGKGQNDSVVKMIAAKAAASGSGK